METLVDGSGKYERWVRLPKRGHEPNCGLSRPFIYELIRTGKVRSASSASLGAGPAVGWSGCNRSWITWPPTWKRWGSS